MKFQLDTQLAKAGLCLLAVLVLLLGALAFFSRWEEDGLRAAESSNGGTGEDRVFYDGEWHRRRSGMETLLFMGIDKYAEQDGPVHGEYEQADFIMLLIFDKKAERCTALHLNRDTMANYEKLDGQGRSLGAEYGQLALAHTYGGDGNMRCRNMAKSVKKLLYGTKVDHYLSLTMDGIVEMNDLLGGVTVTVEDDFSHVDSSLAMGKKVTLTGQQALTFVRSRRGVGDGSNLGRMRRQRQYMEGLQQKWQNSLALDSGFASTAFEQINPYMVSDCSVQKLTELSGFLSKYGVDEIISPEGENDTSGEFVEFTVDEAALQALVMELFYEKVEG